MPSAKRRTNSSSGASRKSMKRPDKSGVTGSTYATSPRSFEEVFGTPETPQQQRWRQQLLKAQERLTTVLGQRVPENRLLKARHLQKVWRLRRYVEDLESLISNPETGADA